MIKVVAKAKLKSDVNPEDYIMLAKELVAETRKENGCLYYALHQDIKDPAIFTMLEEWEDEKALEQHNQSAHMVRILPELKKLRESGELNIYREIK
ncbi:putative quinol monooxygenase [Neobacillus kokaensis]|uniref:Antibiotic biosynthesis monooxygenase n=1 Tax=Neobacillus kokaensis TaxID=2759023 RepID=A0ABQ3N961_9BACI|nr:putative quinol monooxygenase [Neobacillus kokaensis]GHH99190.1 antibiotic biosynthesis monooxygenase [Neobacillus kokaensis]